MNHDHSLHGKSKMTFAHEPLEPGEILDTLAQQHASKFDKSYADSLIEVMKEHPRIAQQNHARRCMAR